MAISEPHRDVFFNSFRQSAGGATDVSATAITGEFVDNATSLAGRGGIFRGALRNFFTFPNDFGGDVRKSVRKGAFYFVFVFLGESVT